MSNLSAPSRKRLSELGLPAWRGCAGKDASGGVLDEERGEGGSASSHPSPSSRSAASGRHGKEEEDADSQSLRSHYSGMGSPQQSNHSGSPGGWAWREWLVEGLGIGSWWQMEGGRWDGGVKRGEEEGIKY